MENTRFQRKGHGKKESLREESSASQLKLVKRATSHQAMVVNKNSNVFQKELFFLLVHGHYKVPKFMATADEIYLRRCLELVHISAMEASQHNITMNSGAKYLLTSAESMNVAKFIGGGECGSDQLVLGHSLGSVTKSVGVSSNANENWSLGTVMETKSVINILNSPLLQHFGVSKRNENLSFTEAKSTMTCNGFKDFPSGVGISSSYKQEMEIPMVQSHHEYGSMYVHKRVASSSITVSQGMLQCTWKQGIPQFVFSADDQNEVYVAKLNKVDKIDGEALDYVYLFHLSKGGQEKGHEIPDHDLQLVGKMNVSTSFTLCPDNYRVMETQFRLFGNIKNDKEVFTSTHAHMKNKGMGMAQRVSRVLRSSPSSKHRTLSKFSRSKAIRESSAFHGLGGTDLLETNVVPKFELAAIVFKSPLLLDKVGGWGLKFLKKVGVNQTTLSSHGCSRNTRDCSTSMIIVIPAGLHGGPRTRHGGPSSLIDRWKSGGSCDCGGWDEGCPLTILQKSKNEEIISEVGMQSGCKVVDLVAQGSSNFNPTLRMVNIHDGLYFIHFQPPLSPLQSFSIAVAIIHTQSPTLRPSSAQKM
ncbi:hypothetical protein RJT34_24239 [Clitoria ternatea]|uniref:Uncharacterized protein n=1 Tax=Clitoria ternatea TaxID=43366 RepID=A0AAN9FU93_CLITE